MSVFIKKQFLFGIFLVLSIGSMTISPAYAEDNNSNGELSLEVQIAEKDIMFNGLRTIAGNTVNIAVDDSDPPEEPDHVIAALSQTLNYSLMSFALLFMVAKMFFWLFKADTGDNDEKILDFQHAPMAVFISVLVLLPLSSGYSMLQHVVIWSGVQSISIANKLTNTSAEFLDRNGGYAVPTAPMNTAKTVLDGFNNFVCVHTYATITGKDNIQINNERQTDWFGDDDYIFISNDGMYSTFVANSYAAIEAMEGFANGRTLSLPEGVCGTQALIFGSMDDSYGLTDEVAHFRDELNALFTNTLNDRVNQVAADFVESILVDKDYTEAKETYYIQTLEQISEDFNNQYLILLNSLVNKFDPDNIPDASRLGNANATEKLREYGAGYLGVYFWEYAKRNAATAQMTKVRYNANGRINEQWAMIIEGSISTTIDGYTSAIEDQIMANRRDNSVATADDTGIELIGEVDTEIEKMLDEGAVGYSWLGSLFVSPLKLLMDEQDPVRGLMDAGQTMITTSEVILSSSLLIKAGSMVADYMSPIMSAVDWATGDGHSLYGMGGSGGQGKNLGIIENITAFLSTFAIWLMIFGILLAFGLPSIPIFHWISGLIGFFIVFGQALVLAPMLAIAHLLSGEKTFMNQRTNQGYMAIIQLVTYLPLMVFSFFLAYLILMVGTKIAQIVFIPFYTTLIGNSLAGIVTSICMFVLFFLLNVQIFNRCFSLITVIPEKAGKFIGGGEESLGDGVDEAKGHFIAVAQKTGGGAGKAGAKLAQKVSGNSSSGAMKSRVNR